MKRFNTKKVPAAIGPYSQATIVDGTIYCSGQIALIPETGEIFSGTIEEETRFVLNNIKTLLNEAGSSLDKVIKATLFIKNMDDFPKINTVYGEFFGESKPSRSTVEVSRLPKDVNIEIEILAKLSS